MNATLRQLAELVQGKVLGDADLVICAARPLGEDEGPGFDPHQVPDPLAPENLEKSSGRGLLLMRTYMTWIRYNECGNQVTLCKQRSSEESSPAGEEQV